MKVHTHSGFTVVELVISVTILGLALSSAAIVSKTGNDAHRASTAVQAVEQTLQSALERAAAELATTGADHLEPDPVEGLAYDDVEFQAVVGQTDGEPDLGDTSQLVMELDNGEFDDGVDNDGDGLVDERRLVLVRDVGGADEQRVVLCRGVLEYLEGEDGNGVDDNDNGLVDEPGFHLERDGDVLTLRLSIAEMGPQGTLLVRTAELDTRMRN